MMLRLMINSSNQDVSLLQVNDEQAEGLKWGKLGKIIGEEKIAIKYKLGGTTRKE